MKRKSKGLEKSTRKEGVLILHNGFKNSLAPKYQLKSSRIIEQAHLYVHRDIGTLFFSPTDFLLPIAEAT